MRETEEIEKAGIVKTQKSKNKKTKNAETLAAVHTHTHKCFRE